MERSLILKALNAGSRALVGVVAMAAVIAMMIITRDHVWFYRALWLLSSLAITIIIMANKLINKKDAIAIAILIALGPVSLVCTLGIGLWQAVKEFRRKNVRSDSENL